MVRKWLPYELNHLIKYGFPIDNLEQYGERPVEYITGHATFYGLDFLVTPDTLIPRIETEEIVAMAKGFRIADMACGSGCLGISVAKKLEEAGEQFEMVLSDISELALAVAKKNAQKLLSEPSRLTFIESDLFDSYPEGKFNLVLANLPYIPTARLVKLDKSVTEFEPLFALDGGSDGLTLIKRLLRQLPDFMETDGLAILEIDETHKLSDFSEFIEFQFEIKKDQFGKNRFLLIKRRRRASRR